MCIPSFFLFLLVECQTWVRVLQLWAGRMELPWGLLGAALACFFAEIMETKTCLKLETRSH